MCIRDRSPNSGKSTLIRILGGISEPSKGNVTKKENLTISYLGHKNALKSYLSVRDNLDLLDLWDNDEINNLRKRAIEHVDKNFSLENMCKKTLDVYDRILNVSKK